MQIHEETLIEDNVGIRYSVYGHGDENDILSLKVHVIMYWVGLINQAGNTKHFIVYTIYLKVVEYTCTCISHAFFDVTNGSIESGFLNVEWKGSVWKLCKKKQTCKNGMP